MLKNRRNKLSTDKEWALEKSFQAASEAVKQHGRPNLVMTVSSWCSCLDFEFFFGKPMPQANPRMESTGRISQNKVCCLLGGQ